MYIFMRLSNLPAIQRPPTRSITNFGNGFFFFNLKKGKAAFMMCNHSINTRGKSGRRTVKICIDKIGLDAVQYLQSLQSFAIQDIFDYGSIDFLNFMCHSYIVDGDQFF